MNNENPYLEKETTLIEKKYNPDYGDNRICECGHSYDMHFDWQRKHEPVKCICCGCGEFREKKENPKVNVKEAIAYTYVCPMCGHENVQIKYSLLICDSCNERFYVKDVKKLKDKQDDQD